MTKRPIYYDTETTGVRAEKDRIIELAAYDPYNDKTFVQLINPGFPIPPESTAIHHITDDMVANAPTFAEIAGGFVEFCDGDSVLIAHNNDNFDLQFLKCEFGRNDIAFPTWIFLDSLKWARRYRPDLPRHTLQILREVYGIEANNAHRALDDVMVLYKLISAMVGDLDFDTILSLMAGKPQLGNFIPKVMPFGKHQGKPLEKVPKDYVLWLKSSGAFDKSENENLRTAFDQLGFFQQEILL
ncbi:MAG: DUF3820 family protein [Parachlamydiales bacterium]|nr:DUF3820 family protein [Parachlamydiales bacterium]